MCPPEQFIHIADIAREFRNITTDDPTWDRDPANMHWLQFVENSPAHIEFLLKEVERLSKAIGEARDLARRGFTVATLKRLDADNYIGRYGIGPYRMPYV